MKTWTTPAAPCWLRNFTAARLENSDGLDQIASTGHGLAKRAPVHDLLLGRWSNVELDAGNALQLAHRLLQNNRELPLHRRCVHADQVEHRRDAAPTNFAPIRRPTPQTFATAVTEKTASSSAAVIAPRLQTCASAGGYLREHWLAVK